MWPYEYDDDYYWEEEYVSIADTAEYQLGSLAETLSDLSKNVTGTAAYKEAYRQALADVAHNSGLTAVVTFTYP